MAQNTGYPGKKTIAAGVTKEYADFVADKAARDGVTAHENLLDPHPQYTTDAEATALAAALTPRFVTYWKWS